MKTLIFNGSPRPKGETAQLIERLSGMLSGDIKVISSYRTKAAPCVDCRYCFTHDGCCVKDEMQEIYPEIESADNIVIASPVYFYELTGSLLSLASRLQPYFCAKFLRKEPPKTKPKKGAVITVFGGNLREEQKSYSTAAMLLDLMNCQEIHPLVYADHTDERRAVESEDVLKGIRSIAEFLNSGPDISDNCSGKRQQETKNM